MPESRTRSIFRNWNLLLLARKSSDLGQYLSATTVNASCSQYVGVLPSRPESRLSLLRLKSPECKEPQFPTMFWNYRI